MYKCNKCNRFFNKKYDNCPVCNSNEFTEEININNKAIENHECIVSPKIIEKKKKESMIILVLVFVIFVLVVRQYGYIDEIYLNLDGVTSLPYAKMIINTILIIIGFIAIIIKIVSITTKYERLKNGTLIKNIPCEIVPEKNKYRVKVKHINNLGEIKEYVSDMKKSPIPENTTTADLLIDTTNPQNYYIDFEIY